MLLGLEGATPEEVEPAEISSRLKAIRAAGRLRLLGRREIALSEQEQLLFQRRERLPYHSNG